MDAIVKIATYSPTVIYLIGIYLLWRQNQALQAKYEGLLREAITALGTIAKELEHEGK